jgi:hypothetical protein
MLLRRQIMQNILVKNMNLVYAEYVNLLCIHTKEVFYESGCY